MNSQRTFLVVFLSLVTSLSGLAQNYFFAKYAPFNKDIPSPEAFLGYPVGAHHTRHDKIVAYLDELAKLSDRATIARYGETHERRELVMLTITSPEHLANLDQLQQQHMQMVDPDLKTKDSKDLPVFINLAYNVHGNEPSSAEAAMLAAYTLVASQSEVISSYLDAAVVFIDPTINPDGRDRHTQWANSYQGSPLVDDPMDAEHNEGWPRGRTNHYWFDLNRDWLLAVNPESRGKLNWFHQWYPNVVTDFHEMGTTSTYFFEPMKPNASRHPLIPKENYTKLNDTFARYFSKRLDEIGSLYFTKEAFDGTYPGYGSSYPDLQGGLALLFEQASSRGHVQQTPTGKITFAFTIRNQYTSSLATIEAAVENREMLYDYQQQFFKSAINNAASSKVKAYVFGDSYDENRTRAFIDKLLIHRIKVYGLEAPLVVNGKSFKPGNAFIVPTKQPQYRMVQTMFETYKEYTDSVFYDASAWSLANFYNMTYAPVTTSVRLGTEVTRENNSITITPVQATEYAYLIPWDEYTAPAALYYLLNNGANVSSAFKPFSITANNTATTFGYGTLLLHVQRQTVSSDSLFSLVQKVGEKFHIQPYAVNTGFSLSGIDLGSRNIRPVQKPKALMLIGDGVSSYEAGEIWHLLDTRVHMPVTKLQLRQFGRADLDKYNTLVMVSGGYAQLDSNAVNKIKDWVGKGNTLITTRQATAWAIKKKLVKESLLDQKEDKKEGKKDEDSGPVKRKPYVEAPERYGQSRVGGAIFAVDLDITHPLAFGYHKRRLPVYRNSNVWLAPSKNEYSTVALYTSDPHIDGFISKRNMDKYLQHSASLIVSAIGKGRVIMFADNPNFRSSWYGTNRLFLNALMLGNHIAVPKMESRD
jgi:hypothetical protein